MLRNEVAVEEPQDRRLGDSLGKGEIILGHGLRLGEPCQAQPALEGSLLAGGLLEADQSRQDLQHRAPFAGCLIEHFAVAPGDLRQLQFGQVTVQPCLEVVITSCHAEFSSVSVQKRS